MDEHDPPMGPRALWAPWRLPYLEDVGAREKTSGPPDASTGSFLRDAWLNPARDLDNHVVVRGRAGLVMLNRFPYANGHLLVALGEARPTLMDYEPDQRADLWLLTDCAVHLMHAAIEPQGINIGVNQGRSAGAGVPQHLHVHLVPRWSGDVNFMSVVGQVRVIPAALEDMADRYRRAWNTLRADWPDVG